MRKLLNNRFLLNLFAVGGLAIFFSSCAREQATLSYENEKLRKQSLEMERSYNFSAPTEENNVATEDLSASTSEAISVSTEKPSDLLNAYIVKSENGTAPKLSTIEKLAVKKLAKKLDKVQSKEVQTAKKGGLDHNLKLALILGVFALILLILGSVFWLFWILGLICLVIAMLFLLFWLLENV